MPQPYLHEHLTCVAAPATWLSPPSGTLTGGADGLYVQDRRVLSHWRVTLDGTEPVTLTAHRTGAASARFSAVPPDAPALSLQRHRLAEPAGGTETLTLTNASPAPLTVELTLTAATDCAPLGTVRAGQTVPPSATPSVEPIPSATSPDAVPASPGAPSSATSFPDASFPDASFPDASSFPGTSSSGASSSGPASSGAPSSGTRSLDTPSPGAPPIGTPSFAAPSSATSFAASSGAFPATSPAASSELEWRSPDGMSVRVRATPPASTTTTGAEATLRWRATVPPRGTWSVELRVTRTDLPQLTRPKRFSTLRVSAADRRLDALVRTGVQDLDALRHTEGADAYYAAGSPWYLTLFGRDALWSARLALPLGHDVAAGTLRTLAAHQGTRHDEETEEEPGRILHEVRRPDTAHSFPPVYYGTVDATPLFVTTLAAAYRWGMPADAVRALLPNVRRALAWLQHHDGFITHRTTSPALPNQGWKDSTEAIQHADGRPARGPIALSEVQAYAYQAAHDGAWLLEQLAAPATPPNTSTLSRTATDARSGLSSLNAWLAEPASEAPSTDPTNAGTDPAHTDPARVGSGRADADAAGVETAADEAKRWRAWADELGERFRAAFWCPEGYPALALDGDGERVDLAASNMGHLLGTGLLTPPESAAVAGHLAGLRSPFGIRTVSPASYGYNFRSYHLGSVWPHDNAIALLGLVRDGHRAEASAVITALLDAAERFGYRLPELYGGDDLPTPYPSACSPQAWAAAVAPAILIALLGLDVDVPAGRITFAPLAPSPVGAYRVRGLKIADGELDVSVTAAGELTVHNGPLGVTFHNADGSPARVARPS